MSAHQSPITTHVLDTAQGRPAVGVGVILERLAGQAWVVLGGGTTDADGRVRSLLEPGELRTGTYRLIFETGAYFAEQGLERFFYPQAVIVFSIAEADDNRHYHVPLLLSPFGYSTYRGS